MALFALAPPLFAMVNLEAKLPGVAVEGATALLIALPIQNFGDTPAFAVTVSEVKLKSAHLESPNRLPAALGAIAPDQSAILDLRFLVPRLDPSRVYQLEIEGRYGITNRDSDREHRRERDSDREDRREFRIHVAIEIPPLAPGSAASSSNKGITNKTAGPYPTLQPLPEAESNESRPPTPLGSPQSLYPPTPFNSGVQNPGGAGASVVFDFNTQSNGVYLPAPPDPSAVGSGGTSNVVLATGNLYIKVSTDGGNTFPTTISANSTTQNFSTVFGDNPDGGYCCDQVVHYIPSIDRIVWLIQTNQKKDASGNVTGHNSLRVAWARPADIRADFFTAWTWFDLGSDFLGLGNDWLDFPDISTANGHLYVSVDDQTKGGLVVARISYSDLQLTAGSIVTWEFTDPTKSTSAVSSHLTQNASDTMYWAGHNGTAQLRIFSWGENSNQYSWRDTKNTDYSTSDYTSKAPDGQYWLAPRPKGDSIIGAVRVPFVGVEPGQPTQPDELWFAWDAGRDPNFAQPYIRIAMIDTQNFNNVGEYQVWNSGYAFAYPALSVNPSTAEVAISLMWGGGGNNYMNHAVGFLRDFSTELQSYVVYNTTASDVTFTATPRTNCDDASGGVVAGRCTRSGDYLSLRPVGTASDLFGTLGYEINLVNPSTSTDCLTAPGCLQNVRWVEFGRPAE
jgi:hypothetical protein